MTMLIESDPPREFCLCFPYHKTKVIKREVVTKNSSISAHIFFKIGGVLFWQKENFSSEIG